MFKQVIHSLLSGSLRKTLLRASFGGKFIINLLNLTTIAVAKMTHLCCENDTVGLKRVEKRVKEGYSYIYRCKKQVLYTIN